MTWDVQNPLRSNPTENQEAKLGPLAVSAFPTITVGPSCRIPTQPQCSQGDLGSLTQSASQGHCEAVGRKNRGHPSGLLGEKQD